MAKSRKNRKAHCARNSRRMNGGGTQYYSFGQAVSPAALGYPTVIRTPDSPVTAPGHGQVPSGSGLPMKGGRYQFAGSVTPNGLWESGGASIGCEASRGNSLNQGGPAPTTTPLMRQSGGVAPFPYALQETTGGYTQLPAGGQIPIGADGTPFMIHVPSGGRMGISPSCITTGGGRRRGSRRRGKGSRRRHRKSARKH